MLACSSFALGSLLGPPAFALDSFSACSACVSVSAGVNKDGYDDDDDDSGDDKKDDDNDDDVDDSKKNDFCRLSH